MLINGVSGRAMNSLAISFILPRISCAANWTSRDFVRNRSKLRRESCSTPVDVRSEEHTSELQSLMRISYAVFCLKKKKVQHMKRKRQVTRQHTDKTR